jgi:hypothetical protein
MPRAQRKKERQEAVEAGRSVIRSVEREAMVEGREVRGEKAMRALRYVVPL